MGRTHFDRFPVDDALRAPELDVSWRGADAYIAPPKLTPLSRALLQKTNAGVITFVAACVLVAARRLEGLADTQRLHWLVEVLLAYEEDPLAYSGYRRPKPSAPPSIPEQMVSAVFTRCTAVFQSTPGKHDAFPPLQAANNVYALCEHIVGPRHRPALDRIIAGALEGLEHHAANPGQQLKTRSECESDEAWARLKVENFGSPLPLEALAQGARLDRGELTAAYRRFADGCDPTTNPYLRSRA